MPILPSFSVKDVLDLVKKGSTIEAQEKIMELRQAALDLQDENAQLREQLRDAERRLELRQLTFDGHVYWSTTTDGQREGPFCPRCCDADAKRIRLHKNDDASIGWKGWRCHSCKENFWYETPVPPPPRPYL